MKVTVREKPMKEGRKSLYLDFYPPISNPSTGKQTRREFLGLYIFEKPVNELERRHNRETRQLAANVKAKRQLDIQDGNYGFLAKKKDADFLGFFKDQAEKHKAEGKKSKTNWLSAYNYFYQFTNGHCTADKLTEKLCDDFREYLQTAPTFRATKKRLAKNSAVGYFTIFKTALKLAYEKEILVKELHTKVKRIKKDNSSQREYLTFEELKKLAKTDCELPILKQAALFSALTGLRYGDIEKLMWGDVRNSEAEGYFIRFVQEKVEEAETMPISEEAYGLFGEPKEPNQKVFKGLLYSSWQNQKLQEWAHSAGIHRKITFHCFRHTYATLQLTLGEDIYVVSKMLGHRSLATTQIYAKIIDDRKKQAANRIKLGL